MIIVINRVVDKVIDNMALSPYLFRSEENHVQHLHKASVIILVY